jgi:16S rRNA (adenine(1408)-N(1))-methyltransferase
MALKLVVGRKIAEMNTEEFHQLRARYKSTMVDLGTGDGRFVYRNARTEPDTLCIGIEPQAKAMQEISRKLHKKPARGGLSNALFIVASLENLPTTLHHCADTIFVNYPWASLLAAFVVPDLSLLTALAQLAKPQTQLQILLNYSVFEDAAYMQRLGLPDFCESDVTNRLAPALTQIGATIQHYEIFEGPPPSHTSWAKRLVAGASRKTLAISAVFEPQYDRNQNTGNCSKELQRIFE